MCVYLVCQQKKPTSYSSFPLSNFILYSRIQFLGNIPDLQDI